MRSCRVPSLDHPVTAGLLVSAALAQLCACAAPVSVPATDPTSQPPAAPITAPADPPTTTPAATRPCDNGERLDSGCACQNGACFDICCGPQADCAHPASPGGPSACMLRMPASPAPPEPAKACTDGELLAHGCTCEGTRCMDLCCVGSACRHHSSPMGGSAKCMKQPR